MAPRVQGGCVARISRRTFGSKLAMAHTPNSATIDLNDDASLQHWMQHFGVTQVQLKDAVQAAGMRVEDVHRHLLDSVASAGAG
jgi:hypothetical protein